MSPNQRHALWLSQPSTTLATLLVILALAVGCTSASPGSSAAHHAGAGEARVVRVIDGDTIVVDLGGREQHVRLLGIDTPESVKPGTPPECFSHRASVATKDLLAPGTVVRLTRDVEARDVYGRLLAYVYLDKGNTFVNLTLVERGDAGLLTYPPNTTHAPELSAAAAQARSGGRGLWSACGAIHHPAGPGQPP